MLVLIGASGLAGAAVDKPTSAQKQAAEDYLDAVASGSAQAVAFAIHPADIEALRTRILKMLRDEATRGDGTIRGRLFGPGMSLAAIERFTAIDFYTALARKLYLTGREYKSAEWLGVIPDRGDVVQVVLRGKQDKDHGNIDVVNVVSIKPYGKDWKAALPSDIEAQIDDLMHARRSVYAALPQPAAPAPGPAKPGSAGESGLPPAISELLGNAEKSLIAPACEEYYQKYMSPNFRRVTSKKALEALITTCKNSMGTREMLLSTMRIVRGLTPRFDTEGQRAVYDLTGQGLPFDRFVLELVDKHWYIAE